MTGDFSGKVALVTGGGKGIGRAISLELARRGADVAVNYRSGTAEAGSTAESIREMGVRAAVVPGDITDPDAVADVIGRTRAQLGPIGLLVNNAAYTRMVPPRELSLALWRKIFAANVDAAFQMTWLAAEDMRAQGGGAVVNVSSTSSLRPDASMIAYGASKAALNAFTASASLALIGDGIRVNAVAPGFTRTPRVDTVDPATQAAMLSDVPMGRLAEAEEIASVAAFLLSDAASYVTGQVITAAGGP